MKKKILSILCAALGVSLSAQVSKKIIVEHFTNTVCSVCASNNPGLFTNLANNPGILHISIHPSKPYSSCLLYKHNTIENDARTNFYGILSGTPRVVINGVVIAPTSLSSATLFDNYKNKTTAFTLNINQELLGSDSIAITVKVKAVSTHSFTNLDLYIPILEDSMNYTSPNGETLHHNVFRKVAYSQSISAPVLNDSIIVATKIGIHKDWKLTQIKTMAFLQNSSDKSIEQADESDKNLTGGSVNSIIKKSAMVLEIYPNPVLNTLTISGIEKGSYTIVDAKGSLCLTGEIDKNNSISTEELNAGLYVISIQTADGMNTLKFVKN